MALPFCDNFWQAQASIMVTPRMPLYIIEMYASVLYCSSIAARRFKLSYGAEAAMCGILAHLLYHTYDINGPRYLWWTWHDGDPAISKRQLNAPIGSSMWILTYCGLHSVLNRYLNDPSAPKWTDVTSSQLVQAIELFVRQSFGNGKEHVVNNLFRGMESMAERADSLQQWIERSAPSLFKILAVGSVCTPVFMMIMGQFQIFSLDIVGVPGPRTYRLAILTYIAILVREYHQNPSAL